MQNEAISYLFLLWQFTEAVLVTFVDMVFVIFVDRISITYNFITLDH